MSDVARMASLVVNTVKAALDPVSQRLSALEQRPPPIGLPGPPGEKGMDGAAGRDGIDGKDGDIGSQGERGLAADTAEIESLRAEIVTLRAELGTQKDWTAGLTTELRTAVDAMHQKMAAINDASANTLQFVKDQFSALPAPEKGADGQSVTMDDVAPLIATEVQKAISALPAPKDGINGKDGPSLENIAPLIASHVQKAVAAIPMPKDGVSVTGAVQDRDGHLLLTLADGTMKDVGQVAGKDGASVDFAEVRQEIKALFDSLPKPKDGKDGADGVGFDDFDAVYDEFGRMSFKFVRGDVVKQYPVHNVIYRGVWKEGTAYQKSDSVTWGGSSWITVADTTAKPGEPNQASRVWVLAIKRGSDGKGLPGPAGKDGRDGKDGKWGQ